MNLQQYAQAFNEVEQNYEDAVAAFGLPFEAEESCLRSAREDVARTSGCHCENGDTSLWRNWISPACLACRTGERTATFFVDLRCTRHCYFCFNPNQDHYEYFLSHTRDIASELRQAHAQGVAFDCLAVTGGEPMLHKAAVLEFLQEAQRLYPAAHTRLYTSGDLLDERGLDELTAAGLTEIRFSVKPEDFEGSGDSNSDSDSNSGSDSDGAPEADAAEGTPNSAPIYQTIQQAVERIPHVVIEMPVIPGTLEQMKTLLVRADELGVRGLNLLEFCFPLCNAEEFSKRGFKLRKHPFNYLYDYWYGGGVPVAGSETEALELLQFATREDLKLGVHYCSSDNKNTGQVYQQNLAFEQVQGLKQAYPWLEHDASSNFLVCAKAFGADVSAVKARANEASVPYAVDADVPCISLPLSAVRALREGLPNVELGKSINIFEQREEANQESTNGISTAQHINTFYLREVAIEKI